MFQCLVDFSKAFIYDLNLIQTNGTCVGVNPRPLGFKSSALTTRLFLDQTSLMLPDPATLLWTGPWTRGRRVKRCRSPWARWRTRRLASRPISWLAFRIRFNFLIFVVFRRSLKLIFYFINLGAFATLEILVIPFLPDKFW